jgi:hypothetical protein
MRVVVVYKKESDYARQVFDFLRDFTHQTSKVIEEIDPETKEGIDFCAAYDILDYPTMLAISDDSVLQNMWRGLPLPTISEVSYYVQ